MDKVELRKYPFFLTSFCLKYLLQWVFPHRETRKRAACIVGCGLLTACWIRDITATSWRPASAEHGYGATQPESPARITLSRQNGLISTLYTRPNGRRPTDH